MALLSQKTSHQEAEVNVADKTDKKRQPQQKLNLL